MQKYTGESIIELDINGEKKTVTVKPSDTLLHILRDRLYLTGAKSGCNNGDCGTCTVLVDDMPIKSCLMLVIEAVGKKITTVEGLVNAPIQEAFIKNFAFQCGYCTSGFLMVCHSLSLHHPDADDIIIQEWLSSNLCRCTGYAEIKDAIKSVVIGKIVKP